MKNNILRKAAAVLLAVFLVFAASATCFADTPWDEIVNYIIIADVNQDGTVNLTYHIDWKALKDNNGNDPLYDVYIGIPNDMYIDYYPLSENIESMSYDYGRGAVHIYFDKPVYANETVSFDFFVLADYMYEMNAIDAGYTLFYFVPGWFDDITIDNLYICWKLDNSSSWSSGATIQDGYLVWQVSLGPGAQFPIKVSYPNDAYDFSPDKSYNDPWGGGGDDWDYDDDNDGFASAIGGLIFIGFWFFIIKKIINSAREYSAGSGFAKGETTTKVTRTKVEYYPNCPGCGAQRKEGAKICEYCGRSFVKSEEIIEEEKAKGEDKEALKYKKNGEYAYTSSPNTYVRVNVIHTPVVSSSSSSSSRSSSSSHSSSSRSSSSHSSCVHSSCACACASCACACACACAGGGRAGCSTKDFYNTKLKLKQLEMKKKR